MVEDDALGAADLLQEAVRIELRRRRPLAAADTHLARLIAEVGDLTPQEPCRAKARPGASSAAPAG
ncbi:MAG: hypothetical protein ABIJ48_09540 [Actinomycetota bacterium]